MDYAPALASVLSIGSPLAKEIFFGKWGVYGFSSIDVDRMQREKNGEKPETDTVAFGQAIKKTYTSSSHSQVQAVKQHAEQLRQNIDSVIEQERDNVTNIINQATHGYVVMDPNSGPERILIMDTNNIQTAQKMWKWDLNGLAYSSTGINGPWSTAAITMNGQIVLVKGVNDGEELERTIHDLTAYIPYMQSLSVVPVGLTRFREGLAELLPFEKEDSKDVLQRIRKWQGICMEYFQTRFVYPSDEWYLTADEEIPGEEDYEGYPQIENGVGMIRSLVKETEDCIAAAAGDDRVRNVSIATGMLAAPTIKMLCEKVREKFPNVNATIYAIRNDFFGERITVSGLLTGQDIMAQLKDKPLGERLILPANLLRSGEDVLLDDYYVPDIEKALNIPIRIGESTGRDFLDSLIE